jgi:predicted Zn-dependent protease
MQVNSWKMARSTRLSAAVLALGLAACGTNPATGQESLLGMSEQQEVQLTQEEHPKILAQYGEYKNPEVQRYITEIGLKLAHETERPNLPWKFTILDSPEINAFALPGGYIYVMRGLLGLASSEAEIASVLGHECGHVAARHVSQRQGRQTLASLGAALAGVLTGSQAIAQLANTAGVGYIQKYSRDQEFQADSLGVRYMSRAGYDPNASVAFLRKLEAESRLEATEAGHPEAADQTNWLSDHPRTADRVEEAIKNAGATNVANPVLKADEYLAKINGVTYGSDPDQGVIKGRKFIHPALHFEFEVPPGFRIINQPDKVLAQAKDGDGIIAFGQTKVSGSLRNWFENHPKASFEDVREITVNGMEGASGVTQGAVNNQKTDMRIVLIRFDQDTVYQFIFASPPGEGKYDQAFDDTIHSFRKLSSSEGQGFQPQRIKVITVAAGDTVQSLSRRMAVPDYPEQWFRVLNGLGESEQISPGQKVKIVE